MRKLSIVMSVLIALAVAAPTFAIDFDATGSLRFQGFYNENASSDKDDKAASYRDMRLRVRTELKVNDKLSLVTRFDALDKILSSNDSAIAAGEDDDNIDFDRAFVKIVTPIGRIDVGRMEGITWGTSWSDDEDDTDRIKYILPIPVGDDGDKFYFVAVAEKVTETNNGFAASDKDNDKYYLTGTYVSENYRFGLLTSFYDYKTFQSPGQAIATAEYREALDTYETAMTNAAAIQRPTAYATFAGTYAAALEATGNPATALTVTQSTLGTTTTAPDDYADEINAANVSAAEDALATSSLSSLATFGTYGQTCEGGVFLISPYFTGKFGNFGITTELDYITGKVEFKDAAADDKDVSAYSFLLETTFETGPVGLQAGFATVSGDTDFTDDDIGSIGYVAPGVDWAKMFILSDDTHGMNTSLGGGLGNHVGGGIGGTSISQLAGYQMFYLGADFDVTESLNINGIVCMSKADDAPATFDDDQGFEIDLGFTWKVMDNLEYKGTAAYLAAGDYWKGANEAGDGEDTLALYHKLELTF